MQKESLLYQLLRLVCCKNDYCDNVVLVCNINSIVMQYIYKSDSTDNIQ